jgi:hypothetical protein
MSEEEKKAPVTLAQWKKAKIHTITLSSGAVVDIQIPDLPALIKAGTIPNSLVDAALGAVQGTATVDKKFVEEQADFVNKLVAFTVVAPAITEEDCANGVIPTEDKELIAEIATRQRDLDAVGHHVGGLHTNKDFRNFRGLLSSDEIVDGL